ncbi:MAG: pilin [Candidatus Altiarchaeota archaeon]
MRLRIKKEALTAAVLIAIALFPSASATTESGMTELREVSIATLQVVGALAVLMIAVHALRYVTSENPQERADIKKGLTYIVIGLLIAYMATILVRGIYCYALGEVWGTATATECMSYI